MDMKILVTSNEDYNPYSILTSSLVMQTLHKDVGSNAVLKSYEVKDFTKKGDNFVSLVTSVETIYELNGSVSQETYIAKLNHRKIKDGLISGLMRQAYLREPIMLGSIVPHMNETLAKLKQLPIRVPKLFASCHDVNHEVLLTEDLRKKGFVMFDKFMGMDFKHAKFVLRELGRFHACSILFLDQLKGKTLAEAYPPFGIPASIDPDHFSMPILSKILQPQLQLSVDVLNTIEDSKHVSDWAANILPVCYPYLWRNSDPSEKFNVIMHGDCWNNNILFKYNEKGEPTDMRFVDFQMSRSSSPACDLVYFFYSSLAGELRQKCKRKLLIEYYSEFQKVLLLARKPIPFNFEELEEEIKLRMPFGCITAMILLPTTLVQPQDALELHELFDSTSKLAFEKRKRFLMKVKQNPNTKSRFLSVFKEMTQAGIFEKTRTIYNPFNLLTEELVEKALQKDIGKQAQMIAFEVRKFTKIGDNYASEVHGIKVHYLEDELEKSIVYVVKLNPLRKWGPLNEIFESFYSKECVVLTSIMQELNSYLNKLKLPPIKAPEVLSYCNDDNKQVMIMKNLRIENFVMFDRKKGMDVKHALLVFEELGRFHASSLLYTDSLNHSILDEYPKEFGSFESQINLSLPGINAFNEIIGVQLDVASKLLAGATGYENVIKWIENMRKTAALIFFPRYDPQEKKFNILSHGDCWPNNMMFKYNEEGDPVEVRLVDFQGSRVVSVGCDINYFFYSGFDGHVRQKNRNLFLAHYYLSFSKILHLANRVLPFSFEELKEEAKKQMLFGCITGMILLPFTLMSSEDALDFNRIDEGSMKDSFQEQKQKSVDAINKNDEFTGRYFSMFDEMLEYKIIT